MGKCNKSCLSGKRNATKTTHMKHLKEQQVRNQIYVTHVLNEEN